MNEQNIAIFVDVQNIYYTTKHTFNRSFNYRKFWQLVSEQGDISIANAYAIAHQDDQQHKFQTALKHIGFDVKTKPFIQRADGSAKGDWDVGITIDVLEAASKVDKIILLSGDGDFDILLKKVVKDYPCQTHVYSVAQLTAASLINAADQFTRIDNNLLM